MEETQLSSVTKSLFTPSFLKSFHAPFEESSPVVYIFHTPFEEPEMIELDQLYPFMTIQDIKTYIYILKGKEFKYHPSFQALLVPMDEDPSSTITDNYIPLDFAFVSMGKKQQVLNTYSLDNPFMRIQTGDVDERFVTPNGDPKSIQMSNRSANTMEDTFAELFGTLPVVLHLFLYSDVTEDQDETLLKTNREWNGRIRPYFPDLPKEYDEDLESEEELQFLQAKVSYVESTLQLMDTLEDLLSVVKLSPTKMNAVKYLRLFWKRPSAATPDVESLFYQIPVTYRIPFLRILPTQAAPITKIYVESALKIPSFDPRLIKQWAEIKGPGKDDFLFGKVMVRDKEGSEPSLFGTLRIFDDRSADYIVQPPQNLKKYLLRDITSFPNYLEQAIQNTYLEGADVDIRDVAVVCQIDLGLRDVNEKRLRTRLQAFSALFQEIPPLPNENPLLMVRYRAVSNFTAEDKIFTFLTQYNSRKVVNGDITETYVSDMVNAIVDTFKVRFAEAKEIFKRWVEQKDKLALANPETKEFGPQYNKGIDIAIFAQQSSYSFHLYRVDSVLDLRRILTALSLLLSAEDENLIVEKKLVEEHTAAASVVDEDERREEPVADEDAGVSYADLADAEFIGDVVDETPEDAVELSVVPDLLVSKPRVQMEKEPASHAEAIRQYFTKRLYDADKGLFPATQDLKQPKTKESVKRTVKTASDRKQSYSAKCQSTEDRQPIVMTEEQYEAMLEIYKDDDVSFLEFPRRDSLPLQASGELVYVLRYGSSPLNINFYLCCKYFCMKDYIMILEKDFKGTVLRNKETDLEKEPNTCPFCEGKLIQNKDNPGPNEWVYRRVDGNNKFPKLLTRTVHPEGLFQPCCFGTKPDYRMGDAKFNQIFQKVAEEEEKEEEEERATVSTTIAREPVNYALTLYNAYKKYIVEKRKFPLEVGDKGGPQIGLLLPLLDLYFQQDDQEIVYTPQQKQELKPDSRAFLRIGVDNRTLNRSESFFSAIAPFLKLNTADDVRTRLLERVFPRNFLFFNYGNLVLEFYNPSDAGPTDTELRLWSQKNLEVELADENKDAILRLWKSYHRFIDFLSDKKVLKEYRQFAQMLAMPNFLTVRGIIFVVLDIVKEGEEERLEVRCPPFGYDNEQYSDADIGFLIHHHTGIWEPIFYSENERAHKQFGDRHEVVLTFQRSLFANWPPIVQKRVLEFTQNCSGSGRAAWTSGSLVDSMSMIPVDRLVKGMLQAAEGVVRDAYNHIVALTYRAEAGKSRLVAIPVVDDGTILTPARLHFDWDDFPAAPIDSVLRFFRENIEQIFSYYPGYTVKYAVRDLGQKKIVAVQLANGLYIPCTSMKPEGDPGIPIVEVEEMEWEINRQIIFGKKTTVDEKGLQTQERKINEAFEYLRLAFSNWFSSESVSGELRQQIQKILFAKEYPLFEKRKRLSILLGPTLLSWMDQEEEWKDEQKSLLRVDCRLQVESRCSGQCVWKASESKCLLHVPESDEADVNVPEMLLRRLFEELLRFPERRRQLLEKEVSPLVSLREPLLIQDQYIVPQSSLAWYDLLRADVLGLVKERKKFYEEMSRDAEPVVIPLKEENIRLGALPDVLKERLDIHDDELFLYRPPLGESGLPSVRPFLVSLGVFESDIGLEEDAMVLTEDSMRELTLLTKRPILQINFQGGDEQYSQFGPAKSEKGPPFVFVALDLDEGGPGMLSLSPTKPMPVPLERFPEGLKYLYDERVKVIDPKKK